MGTYVSDSPLSGFVYQQRNPITECRSDIIKGAGHGCLVKGPADTLWAFYTCQISYVDKNERRIGMDPAGIGGNGNLFVAPVSDTLQWKPGLVRAPEKGNAMGLKPVSLYQLERATTASSFAPGREGIYASDPSMLTWWEPNPNDSAPWLEIDLRGEYELSSMRILWRDPLLFLENGYRPGPYRYALFGTVDGERWEMICDMRDNDEDMPVDYIEFPAKKASKIRLRLYGAPQGVWPGVISVTTFGVMK